MNPITDILDDLRGGKMIVLVDDENRENEGDLVCAAQFVTPDVINFMVHEARGMLCVSLASSICDRLDLPPQTPINTSQRSTAYTVSVDAHDRFGVSTGISAADRAVTTCKLSEPDTTPADLVRPGHVNPLRARDGGVLVRAGQTEGSIDLCRIAGLRPAAAIIEIMNEDGSMARMADLEAFCAEHELKICCIADVIQYRLQREKLIERVDEAPFETEYGTFNLIAYRSLVDPLPHVALTCGDVGKLDATGHAIDIAHPVLVRMHSQNLLGDVFGDTTQASGHVLHESMRMIQAQGSGALVYLRHEGMGKGLLKRLQTMHLLDDAGGRTDPHRAEADAYGIGSQILRDLGIRQLRLLSNHPFHPKALSGFNLEITEFVPVPIDS